MEAVEILMLNPNKGIKQVFERAALNQTVQGPRNEGIIGLGGTHKGVMYCLSNAEECVCLRKGVVSSWEQSSQGYWREQLSRGCRVEKTNVTRLEAKGRNRGEDRKKQLSTG